MFLLEEVSADLARVLLAWDGTGDTPSSNVMDCRFCGFEIDRGRSRVGTSLVGGKLCPEFVRLCRDERDGALATCGATGDDCRCDISSLLVRAGGKTSGLLATHPIGRCEDGGCFLKRTPHSPGTLVSIESGHESIFPGRKKSGGV